MAAKGASTADVLKEGQKGLAWFGRLEAKIGAVLATIVGAIACYIGVQILQGDLWYVGDMGKDLPANKETIGYALAIGGPVVALLAWGWAYLTHKSNTVATIAGAGSVLDFIS